MRRHYARTGILIAGALILAACGGGDGDGDGDEDETTTAADGSESGTSGGEDDAGLTTISVVAMPIVDTAPLYLGIEEGIFEEHGLEIELGSTPQGGAVAVPGVVSGEYDFGFGNTVALLSAHQNGFELPVVANASSSTGDPDADTAGIFVAGDSGLENAADLADMRVAVNTLNSVGDASVRGSVEAEGADSSGIEFIELPFPDMIAALENDQVDGAFMVEPFATFARNAGMISVTSPYTPTDENFNIAVYFTSAELLESDPELVEQFTAAMNESQAFAQDNPEDTRAILSTYMELPPDVQEALVLPSFHDSITPEELQTIMDLMIDQGLLDGEIPMEQLLPNG